MKDGVFVGRSRSARQIAALIGALLAVCGCCLAAVGLVGSGGGGGEGDFVTLIQRRGRIGDGDVVASKEIKEALKEVRATIASLEGKSRSIHSKGSLGQQRAMIGGGAADTQLASSSDENRLTEEDLKCYIEGDAFLRLVNSCCKTLYFGPGLDALLPMDLADSPQAKPFTSGLPYGVRYRYAIGNGNDMVFNGGSRAAIEWMNRYFGFSIKTVEVTGNRGMGQPGFSKRPRTYKASPSLPPVAEHEAIDRMPHELPVYDGMTAVDPASLPPGSTVLYDNVPSKEIKALVSSVVPIEVPGFMIEYCEVRSELVGGGLPMKVVPTDCGELGSRGLECQCGNIVFLGFTWGPAATNSMWADSIVFVDDEARGACPPEADHATPAPMPLPPKRESSGGWQSCDDYHVTYDPPSQHWYYDVEVSGGGTMRWVRHWCPSEWKPQERFYKYQRYMPRSQNNRPAPPINDFDFLDSYARSYYTKSRRSVEERLRKRPFDDWTLGNSDSQLSEEGFDGKRIRGRKVGGSFDDWRLGNSDSPMEQARVREESSRMGQARVWKDVERRFDDDSLGNAGARFRGGDGAGEGDTGKLRARGLEINY